MSEKDFRGKKLLEKIRELTDKNRFRTSHHFQERERERKIFLWEVLFALKNGSHDEARDEWDNKRQIWKYAMRGRTMEARELQIIVSILPKEGLILITVYDVNAKR